MQLLLQNKARYGSVIFKLSLLTALSVIGCTLLGYFLLPPAAAFYACILVYEKQSKRIVSYALPVVMFTVNFLIRGVYSLEALAYVAVGVIIYFASTRMLSKGEAVFWTALAVLIFILLSAILLSFEFTGAAEFISIKQFYSNLYSNYRTAFIEQVTSLTLTTSNGILLFAYNAYEAEQLFNLLVISLVPALLLSSFVITGFSFKIFSRIVNKCSGEDCGIYEWSFKASNIVVYFYIIVAVLSLFSESDATVFGYSLMTLNTFFSVVFAYIGMKNAYRFFLSRGKSALFATVVIGIAFVLLASYSIRIFSYLGVIANIITNRIEKELTNK